MPRAPIVIKADGLAAGKGVVVAMSTVEARAVDSMLVANKMGAAGRVVSKSISPGEEASFIVMIDGGVLAMASGPRSQAACWTGIGPEYRRHGCLLAPRY
jgi:phosphoribosylamine-glycine ligase